ncbi:polysaccharide deacetylase family protein [Brevibacillus fluminis]|uniref:polysaccharide deacetylase family protein n=1 Tax=Brevibacillus fluminis TaxID=511487 RepID=UPI003F8C9BDB
MKKMVKRVGGLLLLPALLAGCAGLNQEGTGETASAVQEPPAIAAQVKNPAAQITEPKQETEKEAKPAQTEVPKGDWVAYKGPVEHIFFHPLIAYPELAFDNDSMTKGYDDWFVTVKEFDHILEDLYKNQYVLISMDQLYEQKTVNGKKELVKKPLMLPKNKKPLVLSVDDMNYYDYMLQNGNVYKLILDEKGRVATYSLTPKGEKRIAYDNEIVPILDTFVSEHPDFSIDGAKGTIALTGYQGVLGYRTNELTSPAYQTEKADAIKVINRMKETGWSFASHGYGHRDAHKISYKSLVEDTERWKKEVEPLVGDTPIYIYPYGSRVDTDSDKYKYLVKAGFPVLCGVGPQPYLKYKSDSIMMDRRHIDGIALKTQGDKLKDLFDSKEVIDSVRPKGN